MCAERGQVWSVLLAINQRHACAPTQTHQGGEGDFGGVGGEGKHRLAKHGAPQADAIQAADQLTIDPSFYAVCVPSGMEGFISRQHVRQDPGAVLVVANGMGAGTHDSTKAVIDANFTVWMGAKFFQRLAQGAVQTKGAGLQHHARVGRPPQNRLTDAEPRKNPLAIGAEQMRYIQGATSGQQTRCWTAQAPGGVGRRKRVFGFQPGQGRGHRATV